MSPATIDRYLRPVRAKDAINGVSTTKPAALLRSAITIGRAGEDVKTNPDSSKATPSSTAARRVRRIRPPPQSH